MRSCFSCNQKDCPDWGTDNYSDDCPYFPDDETSAEKREDFDEEDYDEESEVQA